MMDQVKAVVTTFLSGLQQLVQSPWRLLMFVVGVYILIDIMQGKGDGGTVSLLIGWADQAFAAIMTKIKLETVLLLILVAFVFNKSEYKSK